MAWTWIRENPASWDDNKEAILGGATEGSLDLRALRGRDILPGDWWRVESEGQPVAYAWMDVSWGWAPVLFGVSTAARRTGIGSFIVDQLEKEAHARGLAYIFNVIPASHPEPEATQAFLQAQGFSGSTTEPNLLRKQVKASSHAQI